MASYPIGLTACKNGSVNEWQTKINNVLFVYDNVLDPPLALLGHSKLILL